jgi:hypothetical protein
MREKVQKLKSQVRRLQKALRELRSENNTLLDAWARTESFLQEVTKGKPLEEIIKYKKLPNKLSNKKQNKVDKLNEDEEREEARERLAKWRKENL